MSYFTDLIDSVYRSAYTNMSPLPVLSQQMNNLDVLFTPIADTMSFLPQQYPSSMVNYMTNQQAPIDQSLGSQVAEFESDTNGMRAVGYDRNGGTSYGTYQHSSRQGSMDDFLNNLAASGAEGAAAAAAIRAAGPLNTGSRHGAAVDAYLEQQAKYPELFARASHDTVYNNLYTPMLRKLSPELAALINANAALQEMAWSTAVQHGGTGGARIFNKVYNSGMSAPDLINAVYSERGKHFGSSTPQVRAAVQNRFVRESKKLLDLYNSGYSRKASAITEAWGYK